VISKCSYKKLHKNIIKKKKKGKKTNQIKKKIVNQCFFLDNNCKIHHALTHKLLLCIKFFIKI